MPIESFRNKTNIFMRFYTKFLHGVNFFHLFLVSYRICWFSVSFLIKFSRFNKFYLWICAVAGVNVVCKRSSTAEEGE